MKVKIYFICLFLLTYSYNEAQETLNGSKYNAEIASLVRSDIFVCFPLNIKKSDGKIFKVLTSNYGLYDCFYSKMAYHPEFADTIENILNFEFVGFDLNKCPKLIEGAIDIILYKKLANQGVKKVLKKYFDTLTFSNKQFMVKKKYLPRRAIFTVLFFLSENNYILTSDNDGYYIARLLE